MSNYRYVSFELVIGPYGAVAAKRYVDNLLEYNCSLPSLTTIGKRWKCYVCVEHAGRYHNPSPTHCRGYWTLGEYALHPTKPDTLVTINWYRLRETSEIGMRAHRALALWLEPRLRTAR